MTTSAAGDVLPALPPIRTTAAASPPPLEDDACSSPAASSSSTAPGKREEEAEPTTPTSEESRLRAPTECPPAPRKPAWVAPPGAKRKLLPPRRAFFPVARDLSAVFWALPPKKRIRAS